MNSKFVLAIILTIFLIIAFVCLKNARDEVRKEQTYSFTR